MINFRDCMYSDDIKNHILYLFICSYAHNIIKTSTLLVLFTMQSCLKFK